MPTANIPISKAWKKIANAGESFLASAPAEADVEFAATTADAAPTVLGHALKQGEALTRAVIGDGYIWVRISNFKSARNAANLVVTK